MEDVIKHLDLEQHFAIKPPNQFGFNNLKHLTGILNARKAYNLSILLKQTKISRETLKQSLIEFNENLFGEEILKHLITFAPDSDEIRRYQEFNGLVTDLNEADQFTLQMCRIPSYKTRLRALHFKATFLERTSDIKKKLHILRKAVHELLRSEKLTKILEITLAVGNYMNKGNLQVGEATGFKISFLSQIDTTRSNIGAKTFLHSLVEAVQTKFPLACQISQDLPSIHEAATISEATITTDLNEMKQTIKDILVALKDSPETNTPFTYQQQEFFMGADKEIEMLTEEHIDFMMEFKRLGYYFGGIPKNTTITEFFKMFSDFLNKFEVRSKIKSLKIRNYSMINIIHSCVCSGIKSKTIVSSSNPHSIIRGVLEHVD